MFYLPKGDYTYNSLLWYPLLGGGWTGNTRGLGLPGFQSSVKDLGLGFTY